MPIVKDSSFEPALGLSCGHAQTLLPGLFRKVAHTTNERERIKTADGDFLDLDWNRDRETEKLVVITHGLESNSHGALIQGMAGKFHEAGWDVLGWNLRGCSGELNRHPRFYHSGVSEDLGTVLNHVLSTSRYQTITLIGFSLGGNITLKFLGEQGGEIDTRICRAVTFSVPCDLESSSITLGSRANRIYMGNFLRSMRSKIREKVKLFPDLLDDEGLDQIRSFAEFDERYTAPLNGFAGAQDYWSKASAKPFLSKIRIPTLLVSARNDPFLSEPCFPIKIAKNSVYLHFEAPKSGGHCGFFSKNRHHRYWMETRALEFSES